MMQAIREMVGAAPVCPPERPRSDVSIRKGHVLTRKGAVSIRKRHIPTRKSGVSIHKRCMLTPKHVCALRRWMRPCRATRAGTRAPPLPVSITPLCHATFLVFVHRRSLFRRPFLVFVRRRSLFRRPFLVFVHRRSLFRQSFSILSIGGASSGNLFLF